MGKAQTILLKSGYHADTWIDGDDECLQVDLIDLYTGYGGINSTLSKVVELFQELIEMGYESSNGISIETGYYDSIDGLHLTLKKKKNGKRKI